MFYDSFVQGRRRSACLSFESLAIHRLPCNGSDQTVQIIIIMWAAPWENAYSGKCEQEGPRSACAFAQSDTGLHCQLTESLDTRECINGEQRHR